MVILILPGGLGRVLLSRRFRDVTHVVAAVGALLLVFRPELGLR